MQKGNAIIQYFVIDTSFIFTWKIKFERKKIMMENVYNPRKLSKCILGCIQKYEAVDGTFHNRTSSFCHSIFTY